MKLPEGWEEVELGDILIFQKKTGRKAGEGLKEGKYKFFTSSSDQTKFIDNYDFEGEHLIFSTGGQAGIHYCNKKFSASNDCFVVTLNKISTKYVYYYLRSRIYLLEAGFKGAGLKHISKTYLNKIKIICPEKQEIQKKIVAILEKAEETKKLRAQADELTNKLLRSVFMEMFGDPVKNPKGWERKSLFEACYINPRQSEIIVSKDTEVSFLPMQSITEDGRIINAEVRTISDVLSGFTYFREGDVLFAKITPCMENGKGAIAKNLKNGIGFGSTEFHVLRPKTVTSEWIYYLLSLKFIRKIASKNMTGSAGQKRVPTSFFEKLKVGVPPLPLQQKFARIVEKAEAMQEKQKESKHEIENLFNALMQKAFTGELVA